MEIKLENHPCFNKSACKDHARIHLPVAPKCNVQCGFCNRKYDCVNESRPGVCSSVLSPQQALFYLEKAMEKRSFDVVGIAGPGDPFANPAETMETLSLVHAAYPEMMLCLATNGLGLRPYVPELKGLGVTHVTITINGVEPEVAGSSYRWIRHNKKVYRGAEAGRIMIDEQLACIKMLRQEGILVKINSIIIPGINDHHLSEIASVVGSLDATMQNCLPLMPVPDTDFAHLSEPTAAEVAAHRLECGVHILQMGHCRRCRADAAGLLEEAMAEGLTGLLKEASALPLNPDEKRPYIAVATREGFLINQHLGQALTLSLYDPEKGAALPVDERIMPPTGDGDARWLGIAEILKDCHTLLVSGIGSRPDVVLTDSGLRVMQVEGLISEALDRLSGGEDLRHMAVRKGCCSGASAGCA